MDRLVFSFSDCVTIAVRSRPDKTSITYWTLIDAELKTQSHLVKRQFAPLKMVSSGDFAVWDYSQYKLVHLQLL